MNDLEILFDSVSCQYCNSYFYSVESISKLQQQQKRLNNKKFDFINQF